MWLVIDTTSHMLLSLHFNFMTLECRNFAAFLVLHFPSILLVFTRPLIGKVKSHAYLNSRFNHTWNIFMHTKIAMCRVLTQCSHALTVILNRRSCHAVSRHISSQSAMLDFYPAVKLLLISNPIVARKSNWPTDTVCLSTCFNKYLQILTGCTAQCRHIIAKISYSSLYIWVQKDQSSAINHCQRWRQTGQRQRWDVIMTGRWVGSIKL